MDLNVLSKHRVISGRRETETERDKLTHRQTETDGRRERERETYT